MDQGIGMPKVVEKLVAQPLSLMCTRNKTSYVEELNWDRSFSVLARSIIWLASIRYTIPRAGTVYLEISDSSMRVDGGKAARGQYMEGFDIA
jgi:hypothetical protein